MSLNIRAIALLSFISAIPIIAGNQDFLATHKKLLANENNDLLSNLMFQAEIYVAYKEGDPEQKIQAQIQMVRIIQQMINDFQEAYLDKRLKKHGDKYLEFRDKYKKVAKNNFKVNSLINSDFDLYFALLIRFDKLQQNPSWITLQDIEKFGIILTLLSLDGRDNRKYTTGPFTFHAVNSFYGPIYASSFFTQDSRAFFYNYRPKLNFDQVQGGVEERAAYYSMDLTSAINGRESLEIAPFYSKTGAIGLATMSFALAHDLMPVGFFIAPPQEVHAGFYADFPLGFIRHDYRHIRLLADSMRDDIVYKNSYLKRIYERIQLQDEETKRKDLVFLFLLTHELTFSRTHPFIFSGKFHKIGQGYSFKSYIQANPHNFFQSIPRATNAAKYALHENIDKVTPKYFYLLDLEDVALLIGEIDADFTKNKGLLEPSTWGDFKEFKQAVREKLFELFKDFKSRHHEYKKSSHGYTTKALFARHINLSLTIGEYKKSKANYWNSQSPNEAQRMASIYEQARAKLTIMQKDIINEKLRNNY